MVLQMVPPEISNHQSDASSHGMFMLNSNAMNVTVGDRELRWQLTGGIIDLFVFVGPTPMNVVEQYTRTVGRPHLVPYWALGFHQCR